MSDSLAELSTTKTNNLYPSSVGAQENNSSRCSYGILIFLYIMISSDIFAETILSSIPGAVDGRSITTIGVIISAIVLVLAHIFIMNNL